MLVQSIETKLDSLLDIYRQVLRKGSSSALTLSSLPLFELEQTSDYQSSSSTQLSGGSVTRSASANLPRSLQLVLAPNELNPIPPPSSSFSPSPLPLPHGQPPTPESASASSPSPLLTPNNHSRGTFPELARPPPTLTAPTMLQLPPVPPPPGRPVCILPIPIAGQEARPADIAGACLLAATMDDADTGQQKNKPSAKEEGSWRRHMSLEMDPLAPLTSPQSSSPTASCAARGDCNLGKSLSVQDLLQPGADHDQRPALSPSSSSGDSHCGREPASPGDWGETELFISDKDLDVRSEGFDFLSRQTVDTTFSCELLRTGATGSARSLADDCKASGSTESLSMPHVRLK
ncbi:hypothetical protein AGOR_G00119200 [Albula goreensis]|uniref:Potassium voltage-gated channel, KQT-like subfamily, member 5a n=1 Tax=Albula goreensis TaxID=1534307 RepID=A0A8T3DG65_9TELE|nr:hypothetical protein AGOR_G00119200 [Albula goreensis]